MPVSPLQNSNGTVVFSVFSSGKDVSANLQILSIEINESLNRVPVAVIVLMDGDMPEGKFPVSDLDSFKPGAEIEIKAGYESQTETVFKGIVVRHGISIRADGNSELRLECRDKSVSMTVSRKNANYINLTDSQIIEKIIGNNGLSAKVQTTDCTHKELVQYNCTDWDFILSRAEANNCWVRINAGEVNVEKVAASGSASLLLTYGTDIYEFTADADAQSQANSVEAVSWDSAKQEIITVSAPSEDITSQGNLDAKALEKVLNVSKDILISPSSLQKLELTTWAKARQAKNSLSRIRGSVMFPGSSIAKVAGLIELKGVGDRFSGTVLVTSIRHELLPGSWKTTAGFGMLPQWYSERQNISALPAAGLNSGIAGLHVGIVTKLDGDPENNYRIQVKLPVQRNETEGVWARLGMPYASEQFGILFLPEIGDEVILGFFNGDPTHPVILGSLYSAKRKSATEFAAENKIKSIVTKSKLTIEFEEEKKILTIKTPGGNSAVLSDDGKSITLSDQNKNKVVLDGSGILLDSAKDVKIVAKGKVIVDATGNFECATKADAKMEGMNVNLNAKVGMVAKGSANAEFSASGQTVLKGAMVMIN